MTGSGHRAAASIDRRGGFGSVLTVDGATGSGKTELLNRLALRYGCVAVELGLVVRTVAWWSASRHSTIADSVADLAAFAARGTLSVGARPYSPLAASDVMLREERLHERIFAPHLGQGVAAVALEPAAMGWINSLVREHVRGRNAVISGRDTGTAACPDAGLKIRLEADRRVRASRKAKQLLRAGLRTGVSDDAVLLGASRNDQKVIDTTHMSPERVADVVFCLVDQHLGWRPQDPVTASSTLAAVS